MERQTRRIRLESLTRAILVSFAWLTTAALTIPVSSRLEACSLSLPVGTSQRTKRSSIAITRQPSHRRKDKLCSRVSVLGAHARFVNNRSNWSKSTRTCRRINNCQQLITVCQLLTFRSNCMICTPRNSKMNWRLKMVTFNPFSNLAILASSHHWWSKVKLAPTTRKTKIKMGRARSSRLPQSPMSR